MPKWLRNLIFNAVRAYSYLRRNICRAMDQLASMLARSAMPGGTTAPGASAEESAPIPPLLQGMADGLPDREVCAFS